MSYASLSDLIKRAGQTEIIEVADRDDDGVPDQDVVEAALVHADNLINGYVRARYPKPFESTPALLGTWAVSIARYHLHRSAPPENVETDYKDAVTALKDVARGLLSLPLEGGAPPSDPAASHMSWSPPEVFGSAGLKGWR